MPDNLELFGEIRQIRAHIEGIEYTQEVLIRAHAEAIEANIWDRMDSDDVLARVYLLVDGKRTQTDIVQALQADGASSSSHATVSRKLEILRKDLHLVELVDHTQDGKIYRRTAIDRILGIARKLEKRRENGGQKSN